MTQKVKQFKNQVNRIQLDNNQNIQWKYTSIPNGKTSENQRVKQTKE